MEKENKSSKIEKLDKILDRIRQKNKKDEPGDNDNFTNYDSDGEGWIDVNQKETSDNSDSLEKNPNSPLSTSNSSRKINISDFLNDGGEDGEGDNEDVAFDGITEFPKEKEKIEIDLTPPEDENPQYIGSIKNIDSVLIDNAVKLLSDGIELQDAKYIAHTVVGNPTLCKQIEALRKLNCLTSDVLSFLQSIEPTDLVDDIKPKIQLIWNALKQAGIISGIDFEKVEKTKKLNQAKEEVSNDNDVGQDDPETNAIQNMAIKIVDELMTLD